MNLLIIAEEGHTRGWMRRLAHRLGEIGANVRLATVAPAAPPITGVELLLDFERLVLHRGRGSGSDRVTATAIAPPPDAGFRPDLVVDLGARPTPRPDVPTLAVTWDGVHGEDAAISSLAAGSTPLCEIVDLATGVVLERCLASLENAPGLGGGIASVAARLVTLLVARVGAMVSGRSRPAPPVIAGYAPTGRRDVARIAAKAVASTIVRSLYRLACWAPHWRVGWRLHDGPGIAETGALAGPAFHVLADPGHRFYADPFPVVRDGRHWVFFEDLDHRIGKGVISAVAFDDDGPAGEAVVVLDEPWHLSYPYLIEHDGELWMIPESNTAGDVAIYRCTRFPDRWERVATLLDRLSLSDATVFEHGGRWWMLGTEHDGEGGWSDVLSIHSAPSLFGPWSAHPANPMLIDRDTARPAGAPFRRDGRLFRPVQDCRDGYGAALAIAEVTRLDDEAYTQVIHHRLTPGPRWPGRKFHTLNRAGRLEVIDGSVVRPKWSWLAGRVERATTPRDEA